MINKKFKLFSNCLTVKGINRGIIIDFQRENYFVVPNQVIDFISEYSEKNVYELFKDFQNDKPILKKYIRFFIENELIIVSDDIRRFPAISNHFERPYSIDTITLDLNLSTSILKDFLEQRIDNLGVSSLKLISGDFNLQKLAEVLKIIDKSRIKSVVLYIKHNNVSENELVKLKDKFSRIAEIIFYEAEKGNDSRESNFIYERNSLAEILAMKISDQDDFLLNIANFNESLKYSSAYNRTVFIDDLGNVRRYVEDESIFGNVAKDDLREVVLNSEIISFWEINKDKIKICRDCEFRYICPDGSIPFKIDEEKYYSSSNSCNYSPYTNKWNAMQ
ncbi:grasp-with-spasm system SPASM domain peptide maturase [Flavobacterium foetidum]|uniref:grasp-with-spasm system SPASM domain peptide maturase n=1 Tax=Flavobacterium foetidum TaxID=2026681 RepID=UPI0010752AA1|nr:grasp-with-spasm system SPASM domain peptide maturase [Flavobacterium foetidum]KAF2516654.1 grasp-with-spasm system SPASM domain peptide maturase [Flavobacterium foetidum]